MTMEMSVVQGDLARTPCDVLIVNLFAGVTQPGGGTGAVDSALGGWVSQLIAQQGFTGKANETLDVPTFGKIPARMVVVVGLGDAERLTLEGVRQAAATGIKRAKALKARVVATILHGAGVAGLPAAECAQAVAEGTVLAAYEFTKYKSANEPKVAIEQVRIVERDTEKLSMVDAGMTTGRIIAEAACLARDLVNEPPDVMTPARLAEVAEMTARAYDLRCEIWDEERIRHERMGCLALVGRASVNPPRFIRLDYTPTGTPTRRICLVGKGLCYDSGGISLKGQEHLHNMKGDMAGGAAVIAILRAIAQLRPAIAVTGLIPACENMIDGGAYKVDDILRARNGKTIEIDNTDAEGRLVLADALSYAAEGQFDEVIDMATLTGGCIIALGHRWTGVMGNDQALIDRIIAAGDAAGEPMWMLPFDPEIRELLDSDIADIKNSGGREGSSIQGGMFLREFAGTQPWAHLDIAGTSLLEKKARHYEPKGATGVPVRAMVAYLTRG